MGKINLFSIGNTSSKSVHVSIQPCYQRVFHHGDGDRCCPLFLGLFPDPFQSWPNFMAYNWDDPKMDGGRNPVQKS